MALGSTQTNRNAYRESSGGKERMARKAENLIAIREPTVLTSYNPTDLHGLLQG
jgi:hypothetical protein